MRPEKLYDQNTKIDPKTDRISAKTSRIGRKLRNIAFCNVIVAQKQADDQLKWSVPKIDAVTNSGPQNHTFSKIKFNESIKHLPSTKMSSVDGALSCLLYTSPSPRDS